MFNKKRVFHVSVLLFLIGILTACQTTPKPILAAEMHPAATTFLVRHAEKTSDKTDPPLTTEGRQRAERLADMLGDANITRVYSSDYKRTRDTGAPMAKHLGMEVQLYDAGDLEAIAERLIAEGGRTLVVGHSNTTPQLVELLGGEGGEPIVEATEYNRLYIVTLGHDGEVSTTLLRYGD